MKQKGKGIGESGVLHVKHLIIKAERSVPGECVKHSESGMTPHSSLFLFLLHRSSFIVHRSFSAVPTSSFAFALR
jgi:hypothetical protein